MQHEDDDGLTLLAESLDRFGERLEAQTSALTEATASWGETTSALRRENRRSWIAIAALSVALTLAVLVAFLWVSGGSNRDRVECQRDNQTRLAVVEASRLGVRTSMAEATGDEPEARRVADLTADRVARDPALRLQVC